jgi:hypothetical protein
MTEPAVTTYTDRLGMRVPGMDDELDALRPNWDRLDNTMSGAIWVADGVTPENNLLFEGALIAERNSGKVWRAARNQSGQYEKKWIKYPWIICANSQLVDFGANDVADHPWGFDSVDLNNCVNANLSDIVGTFIKVPIHGLYTGTLIARWGPNIPANGTRRVCAMYDGAADAYNSEVFKIPASYNANGYAICSTKFERELLAGQTIIPSIYQTSSQQVVKIQVVATVALVRAL